MRRCRFDTLGKSTPFQYLIYIYGYIVESYIAGKQLVEPLQTSLLVSQQYLIARYKKQIVRRRHCLSLYASLKQNLSVYHLSKGIFFKTALWIKLNVWMEWASSYLSPSNKFATSVPTVPVMERILVKSYYMRRKSNQFHLPTGTCVRTLGFPGQSSRHVIWSPYDLGYKKLNFHYIGI